MIGTTVPASRARREQIAANLMLICYIRALQSDAASTLPHGLNCPDSAIDFPGFRVSGAATRNRDLAITPVESRPVVEFDAFLEKLSRGAEIFFQIRKSRRKLRSSCETPRSDAIRGPDETPYNHYPFLRRG